MVGHHERHLVCNMPLEQPAGIVKQLHKVWTLDGEGNQQRYQSYNISGDGFVYSIYITRKHTVTYTERITDNRKLLVSEMSILHQILTVKTRDTSARRLRHRRHWEKKIRSQPAHVSLETSDDTSCPRKP